MRTYADGRMAAASGPAPSDSVLRAQYGQEIQNIALSENLFKQIHRNKDTKKSWKRTNDFLC